MVLIPQDPDILIQILDLLIYNPEEFSDINQEELVDLHLD